MRILIADRSVANRGAIVEAFKNLPSAVRVVEVDNGVDCLEKLKRNEFDLAFVDVDMPRIGGMEILALANMKGFRTFIIIMSADLKADMIDAVRQLRAYDFLSKPFGAHDAGKVFQNYLTLTKRNSVLIVDDQAGTRKVVQKVLEQSQFNLRMDEASSGEMAVEWAANRHYDLVFLDLNMPGINGIETCKKLRNFNPNIKVVLITVTKPDELPPEVKEARFNAILHKPFFAADIDQVLRKIYKLHSNPLMRPASRGPVPEASAKTAGQISNAIAASGKPASSNVA